MGSIIKAVLEFLFRLFKADTTAESSDTATDSERDWVIEQLRRDRENGGRSGPDDR